MDTDLWKISDGTTNQSLAEWGIDRPVLSLLNQAEDRLTINIDGEAVDAADLFDYEDDLILYKDSTVWFRGKVVAGPRFGSSQGEGHQYVVSGPWRDLDRLTFQQAWIQSGGLTTDTKTHVVLFRSYGYTDMEVGETVKEILDYAIAKGVGLSYVQAELDALDAVPPYDDQTDITCGEALRIVLRWYPDIVTWFDYSSATPVLHFTRRGVATSLPYSLTAGTVIDEVSIKALPDLQRSGVIINYELQDGESSWNAVDRDKYPVSTTSGLSTLELTIVIGPRGTIEYAPTGLAQSLYNSVSVLHYEGSLILIEEECSSGPRPGKVLNLSNGLTAWASMNALIQGVDFDIAEGRTSITFGPPEHLDPQDYIALLVGNRQRGIGAGYGPNDEEDEASFSGTPYYVKQVNADGDAEVYDEVHMT